MTGLAASHWLRITQRSESRVCAHAQERMHGRVCARGHQTAKPGRLERWGGGGGLGGVWQFSVRGGNGMVLLKLVIRLLWHPACVVDVRGSPPGGEEVHRSGSVIFSVSATLSLVHCQSGHGRSISATLLFSLPKCSNICRKMHKPVELRAADAGFECSVPRRNNGINHWQSDYMRVGKRPSTTSARGHSSTFSFLIKRFHLKNQKCHWLMITTHSMII